MQNTVLLQTPVDKWHHSNFFQCSRMIEIDMKLFPLIITDLNCIIWKAERKQTLLTGFVCVYIPSHIRKLSVLINGVFVTLLRYDTTSMRVFGVVNKLILSCDFALFGLLYWWCFPRETHVIVGVNRVDALNHIPTNKLVHKCLSG